MEYGRAAAIVQEEARKLGAAAVVCVGQAGGRAEITPEVIGINLREADIPDNAGLLCRGEPIVPGGPAGHFSTLPVRDMVAALRQAGIPARLSYSAGAYVCNDVLYTLLHHYDGTSTRVGFIHIPCLPEQAREGCPSLPLDEVVRGLTAAIEAISAEG